MNQLQSMWTQNGLADPGQLQEYLESVDYPATKEELIAAAEAEGAEIGVLETVDLLPNESEFESPVEVIEALSRYT